jgi:hypothetical protein
MSAAKTTAVSGIVAALAVAGTVLFSGEAPAGGQSGDGLVPIRSAYVVPKGKKAIVKVYINGKLTGADTITVKSDSMKLYLKSQLIRSKP